jgi:hypothetical protein
MFANAVSSCGIGYPRPGLARTARPLTYPSRSLPKRELRVSPPRSDPRFGPSCERIGVPTYETVLRREPRESADYVLAWWRKPSSKPVTEHTTAWNTKSVRVRRNPARTLQERSAQHLPNRRTQLGTVRGSFRPLQAGTLAHEMLHSRRFFRRKSGAGEGIRTLDPNLGKVVLYP